MPKPGDKLKRANTYSGRDINPHGFEIIDGPAPIGEQSRNSTRALRRSVSNEGNLPGGEAYEEPRRENVQGNGAIRDQNGPAPNNNEPNNNPINNNIVNANAGNVVPPPPELINQIDNVDNANPQQAVPFQINGYEPQQKQNDKWGKWSKAGHVFARGAGAVSGATLTAPITVGFGIPYSIISGFVTEHKANAEETQKSRNHALVPGREGETFQQNPGEGRDILEDFRRVPTVWSYLTAARAVGANGRDIDPKITVYVEQPQAGSSKSMGGRNDLGHTMLGIEYTRASRITGKRERYNIKYGYYPAGGMVQDSISAMMLKGALVPGQLINDATHSYDISRTYTVSRKQAVAIAEASEKYTEQGGYGYYTRNCTAFVRDMLRVGNLPEETVNSIFKEYKVQYDSLANAGFFAANAFNPILDGNVQRKMKELMGADDKSYQGWGNKRVTKKDLDIYSKTKNTNGLKTIKGLSSAAAGEDMRRMKDEAGQLGSYSYISERNRKYPGQAANTARFAGVDKFSGIANEIERAAWAVREKLDEVILTEEQKDQIAGSEDFALWYRGALPASGSAILDLGIKGEAIKARMTAKQAAGANFDDYITPEEVKDAYEVTSKQMELISTYYQTTFGSDSRINTEVMNLLSVMQIAIVELNETYQRLSKASDKGDIGTLREKMILGKQKVKFGAMEVEMTPSHYESYLQIYKKPGVAIRSYKRYMELYEEHKNGRAKKWSKQTRAEWKGLERSEELAQQLDQSHREILNQNSFAQSDIDYAFRLRRTEISQGTAAGSMYANDMTASMTYMALFFDKLYNGIQVAANRDLPEFMQPEELVQWLNSYLARKTSDKSYGAQMILRGIMRAYVNPTPEKLKISYHSLLRKSYLQKVFPIGGHKTDKFDQVAFGLEPACKEIMDENLSFTRLVDQLIANVMAENRQQRR